MTLEEAKQYREKSNRVQECIDKSTRCGCYYCRRIYHPSKIKRYAGGLKKDTVWVAICPYCDADAVIGDFYIKEKLTFDLLKILYEGLFNSRIRIAKARLKK